MTERVLIDTSAWIEFFRPRGQSNYQVRVAQLIDDNTAALCGVVLAELLRGARSDRELRLLEDRLESIHYLATPDPLWRRMGRNASLLMRKGLQVPTTDLLIATVALEHDVSILHCDRHFDLLAKPLGLRVERP